MPEQTLVNSNNRFFFKPTYQWENLCYQSQPSLNFHWLLLTFTNSSIFFHKKKITWKERKAFIYLVSLCSFLKHQLIRISFLANWSQIHGPSDPVIISVLEISWLEKHSLGEVCFQNKTTQRKHYFMLNTFYIFPPNYIKNISSLWKI